MKDIARSNGSSASTTWEQKLVKIVRPPKGEGGSAAKRLRWLSLPRRNWSESLHVTMRYAGGSEAYVAVTARGITQYIAGDRALVDVLYAINNRGGYPPKRGE